MYIEKKNIGGLKYCEGCPHFNLKTVNIYADYNIDSIVLECENHDACYRINMKMLEEFERRLKYESYEV